MKFATIASAHRRRGVGVAVVVVTSAKPGEGKTGVAAAIARHYAYRGLPVRLARIASEAPGSNAAEDAGLFLSLPFVPGTAATVMTWSALSDPGPGNLLVIESDEPAPEAVSGAATVAVGRSATPAAPSSAAIVVTAAAGIAPGAVETEAGPPPVIRLGEDRTLAGFGIDEVRKALNAEILVPGDGFETTCDYLVIAPIASDAGQPYFRRFDTKAVVVRFDKTDMHLAAMQARPACLVLTGGRRPSDYLFDAASAQGVPVLLSRTDTENTVIALEGIFDRTRFTGERKLDRMAALLEATPLFDALGQ